MKTFKVTRTTVETISVCIDDSVGEFTAEELEDMAREEANMCDDGAWDSNVTRVRVQELLDKPVYCFRVVPDEDFIPEDMFEDAQDIADARWLGVVGFILERCDSVDGDWEQVDSCFGFIAYDDVVADMKAQCALPDGVQWSDVVMDY